MCFTNEITSLLKVRPYDSIVCSRSSEKSAYQLISFSWMKLFHIGCLESEHLLIEKQLQIEVYNNLLAI